jgi:adenylate cyclase class IV
MSVVPFEYEERYKVTSLESVRRMLSVADFVQTGAESQIDHWFIPKNIMSADEQAQWFDYEKGSALCIREKTTTHGVQRVITVKQLVTPGDHSAMTNYESVLTAGGVRQVLPSVAEEFSGLLADLSERKDDESLSFLQIKRLIEQAGRKEYITLDKERTTFRNSSVKDVVVDLDVIPALRETTLGYYTAIEIEYVGDASERTAREVVRCVIQSVGFDEKDVLTKALPGQAIAFLAKF